MFVKLSIHSSNCCTVKMLRFSLILACLLAAQAVPVPNSTIPAQRCKGKMGSLYLLINKLTSYNSPLTLDYSHKIVDIVNFISKNGIVNIQKNSRMKFQATKIFPCGLPSEFTLAISYTSKGKNRKERCLFYLDNPAAGKGAALALCLEPENQRLRLEYQDGSKNPFQKFYFTAPKGIFNLNQNHTIIMTVTVNSVTITFDCTTAKTIHLGRTKSSPVSTEGLLYIGGNTSPVFVVSSNVNR